MGDAREFAADVFRTICDHLTTKSADLNRLTATGVPFDGWLAAEAYLACHAAGERFSEVEFRPTYASEGLSGDERSSLRVGGHGEPGHHLWLFAEFGPPDTAMERLVRLGWKRSAAVMIVVGMDEIEIGRTPLLPAMRIGGTVVQAFDVKRDPADTLVVR